MRSKNSDGAEKGTQATLFGTRIAWGHVGSNCGGRGKQRCRNQLEIGQERGSFHLSTFSVPSFRSLRQASSQFLSHEVEDHVDGQFGGVGGDVAFAGDGCLAFEGAADVVLAVDHGEAAIDVDPFEQWFASCD